MNDMFTNDITKYLDSLYKEKWANREKFGMGTYIWLFNSEYVIRTQGYTIGAVYVKDSKVDGFMINEIDESLNQFALKPEELEKTLNDKFKGIEFRSKK